MKVKSLRNITNGKIELRFLDGTKSMLHPNSEIENINITNEKELKGKALIIRDLTEVIESSGKQRLCD